MVTFSMQLCLTNPWQTNPLCYKPLKSTPFAAALAVRPSNILSFTAILTPHKTAVDIVQEGYVKKISSIRPLHPFLVMLR